jgi:hypothetical protein
MSERTATRMAKIVSSFTPEQVAIFGPLIAAKKITLGEIGEMAKKLTTPEARAKAVALLASGMAPAEAVKKGAALIKPDKTKPRTDDDLTDAEWLEAHCSKQLANLKKKDEFKSNAIMYRRLFEMRNKFRNASKKIRGEFKSCGTKGPFFAVVQRLAQCKHPSQWAACGACGGTGINNQTSSPCAVCFGAAFKLTSDLDS